MDPERFNQHLSQISTVWTLVAKAHGGEEACPMALAALVQRYQSAVYRYLLAMTRDRLAADDLFQEFALRLVRGDFGRADVKRGRFRDYVKSSLINLANNHHRKQKRTPVLDAAEREPAAPAQPDFNSDEEFLADWRKALLDRAWEALAAAQEHKGPPFHAVLRFRTENPNLTGADLAKRLTADLMPPEPFTDVGLRKLLQRARERFTDFLVDEVERSLPNCTLDDLEQEVIDLGFQAYCKRALERRRKR